MNHAQRLRIMASYIENDYSQTNRHAALLAGATALEAMTPRRITDDPATWPEEGVYVWAFHVEVGWTKARRAYACMVRETYSMMGGIPIIEFTHWLPMPPKPTFQQKSEL